MPSNYMCRILNDFQNYEKDVYEYIESGDFDNPVNGLAVRVIYGEQYLRQLFVIVEMYDHKKYGRGKRAWMNEFTDQERKIISKYYLKIYAWYLRTGIPLNGVAMRAKTYATLVKAANFFASL